MIQIETFYARNENCDAMHDAVNEWLRSNDGRIKVKDIKYRCYCDSDGNECESIMIIYKVKKTAGVIAE